MHSHLKGITMFYLFLSFTFYLFLFIYFQQGRVDDIVYFTVWHSLFTFSHLSLLDITPNFRLKVHFISPLVPFFTILHSLHVTLSTHFPLLSFPSFQHPAFFPLSSFFCPLDRFSLRYPVRASVSSLRFFFSFYHFSFQLLQLSSFFPTFSLILSYFIPSNFAIFTMSYFTPTLVSALHSSSRSI